MKNRIMYIECKEEDITGMAKIGRVKFSKTMKTVYYQDKTFKSLKGKGFKANYYDVKTGDYYWISGYKKDGTDRLYNEKIPIYIDEDVQEEYWINIRNLSGQVGRLVR